MKEIIKGIAIGGALVGLAFKAASDHKKEKNEKKQAKEAKKQKDETIINAEVKKEKVNNETK